MQVEVRYRPAFACIFVELSAGDHIVAEADAMATMSANVGIHTRLSGGFFSAVKKRVFGKESLFVNEFHLESGDKGEVVLTQNTPGDIVCMELTGDAVCLQPGAFIAYTGDIHVGTRWAGLRSFIAGEGMFKLMVSGHGKVWFGAYGAVVEKKVQGEYIVDTTHLVAYHPSLKIRIQMSGGIFSSLFSGEGLVTRLEGNGKIYMQTRSLSGLASWLNPRL